MEPLTAADLRALRARHHVRTYELAAQSRIAPTTLTALLNGRRPLDAAIAARIAVAIEQLAARGDGLVGQ